MKKFEFKKLLALLLAFAMITAPLGFSIEASAAPSPGTYTDMTDVYYTKAGCIVYSQPSYTSPPIITLDANIPVQVIGAYSNGWYRINIGVIGYVKWDAVTTAGAIGLPTKESAQILDAQRIAAESGYEFVNLKLNKEKKIKKDIYNSYVGQKVILYAKLDDEIGVSFKMLYDDKIKSDIDLTFTKTVLANAPGKRKIDIKFTNGATELLGQIAIFQFKAGYDMAADIYTTDLAAYTPVYMNTYFTEFSEFAYAPVTQIADMQIDMYEVSFSLTDNQRERMTNIQRGIKYKSYDNQPDYINSIHKRIRKDTEYVDFDYEED